MQTIPIADVPSQTLTATLGGQSCRLRIITRQGAVYMDVYVSEKLIVAGALCLNCVPIIRDVYLGLVGDLVFNDTQGNSSPGSPGLGSRYQLQYLAPSEVGTA
jgi:hypothetical protein